MKKVQVCIGIQKNIKFASLIYDPRKIIDMVSIPAKDTSQEYQRPWKEKRVKEIAKYVAGLFKISDDDGIKKKAKGIIPNCPIINVIDPIKLIKENGDYYILLPETKGELEKCKGKIEVLDGQHRLIAFSRDYLDTSFKDCEKYEIGFIVFQNLTLEEKQEIFMISNDKQEKVESNVLRQIKKWLGLLSEEEENIYKIIQKLNSETSSPIKNRIIIGGTKIKNGLKLTQLSKILNKSKTYELIKNQTEDNQLKVIIYYLNAWKNIYKDMFNNPKHILGKISGFRYVMYIFPYIYEILKEEQAKLHQENIEKVLRSLFSMTGGENLFTDESTRLHFRGETATIALAKAHGSQLRDSMLSQQKVFDPAAL